MDTDIDTVHAIKTLAIQTHSLQTQLQSRVSLQEVILQQCFKVSTARALPNRLRQFVVEARCRESKGPFS